MEADGDGGGGRGEFHKIDVLENAVVIKRDGGNSFIPHVWGEEGKNARCGMGSVKFK